MLMTDHFVWSSHPHLKQSNSIRMMLTNEKDEITIKHHLVHYIDFGTVSDFEVKL